jgi:chromosome segregation ATPase
MTNEKNNTNELVDHSESDPTSEFEISEVLKSVDQGLSRDLEVDEPTCNLGDPILDAKMGSRSEYESTLIEQKKLVEELNFNIELLRSQNRGLEAELQAREEIAADFARRTEESEDRLTTAKSTLESRENENGNTQAALKTADKLTSQLNDKANGLQIAVRELKRKVRSLEGSLATRNDEFAELEKELRNERKSFQQSAPKNSIYEREVKRLQEELQKTHSELDDLRSYVSVRKELWAKLNTELAQIREELQTKTREAEEISQIVEERNVQLIRSREQYIIASEQLSKHKAKVRKLSGKNRELERTLEHEAKTEIATFKKRVAEQYGELVTLRQELEVMRQDNARIEQYSDSLRIQYQEQLEKSRVSTALHSKIQADLDVAIATIRDLRDELDAEKHLNSEQKDTIDKLGREFENEVRQIRFELGAAEETIAGQEALNEQLVSNLMDHQGYRQALENQLNEVEQEKEQTVEKLTKDLKRARQENDDYDRKIRIKDSAIADLIQELSNHTSNIELKGEFDNVLKKIDGFRSSSKEKSKQDARDRVARLLIGNADDRELRFPLFKDRLTIGRTAHNDIQLNLQYVSRRHAVIATENGETRVIDWGSKNGVFVNGSQVTEQVLKSGDTLSIGTADFRYEERTKR